jgi:hypothetical protein
VDDATLNETLNQIKESKTFLTRSHGLTATTYYFYDRLFNSFASKAEVI